MHIIHDAAPIMPMKTLNIKFLWQNATYLWSVIEFKQFDVVFDVVEVVAWDSGYLDSLILVILATENRLAA